MIIYQGCFDVLIRVLTPETIQFQKRSVKPLLYTYDVCFFPQYCLNNLIDTLNVKFVL